MTVTTTTSRADYTGNGATTAFTVPFYFLDSSHLTVLRTQVSTGVITTLALTTDYTVSGAGNPAGGTVTCLVAPTADQKISILRNVPFTQLNTYVPNDPFPAASHERALDQLTMEVQQLDEAQDRALSLPANTPAGTVSAELPTPEANKFIGWNGSATGLQNLDASTLATIVSFANAYSDVFSGNGVQTAFTLTNNPGSLANLRVSISGVVQRPTIDYTWAVGTTLTFTSAPASGTNNILVQYATAAPGPLGIGTIATQNANAVSITGGSITGITDLSVADGGTGASTAANARTNLGLGTIATQDASNVSITGGSITNITDLAIADGGTGASNATDARTNLGLSDATNLNFTQTGTGAVTRSIDARLKDTLHIRDFGTPNTTSYTNFFTKFQSDGGGVALLSPTASTSHTNEEDDNVKALTLNNTRAGLMRLQIGTKNTPVADSINPALVVQKFTNYDVAGNPSSHQVGGIFGELYLKGSGVSGVNDIEGTWIGVAGNCHQQSENLGTASVPDWDAQGNVVGVAGFASAEGFPGNNRIVTALWGYASSPNIDQTTLTNCSGNFVTCGLELNVDMRHPDQGVKSFVGNKGDVVGALVYNYRVVAAGARNWTFGIAFSGSPDDGNFSSTDPTNWSGFHTGIFLDKIKSNGILFGPYFTNTAHGIKFPDSYAASAMRPASAIYLGNNPINVVTDFTGTAANGDVWQSGGFLNFRYSGVSERVLTERSNAVRFASTTTLDFQVNSLTTLRLNTAASAVNGFVLFPAATSGAPAFAVFGSDTDVPIEYRAKGTGRQFFTVNAAEQFEITSTASAVNKISVTGSATTTAPILSVTGSDTNVDLSVRGKGTGGVQLVAQRANYFTVFGANASGAPAFTAAGSDTNIAIEYRSKGTGRHFFVVNGAEQFDILNVASAVNKFSVAGAVTGGAPALIAGGSDANVAIEYRAKGTGRQFFVGNAAEQFEITGTGSAVNKLSVTGAITGNAPTISAVGSDANVDVALTPKGTGRVRFGTNTATSDVPITGYIEIKDAGGTVRKLAVIA